MIRKAALLALLAALGLMATASNASAVERVRDGGFEATTCLTTPSSCTNPSWLESGTQAFVCRVETCADQPSPPAATGSAWAALGSDFGHPDFTETGFLSQPVEIPSGPAVLSFKLRIVPQPGAATASVSIDTELVLPSVADSTVGYSTYTPVSVDVSAHAGPGAHALVFQVACFDTVALCSRFDIDDVSLTTPDPPSASTTTGQRAAALKKCKNKKSKKARKKCKRRARQLPV